MKKEIIIWPCGMGVNSVALGILLVKNNIRPDFIPFANTGGYSNLGEKHETYRYKRFFSNWLKSKGFPEIKTVVYNKEGLYNELIRLGTLPSVAFGWKSCSQKWKIRAVDKWLDSMNVKPDKKIIGYDAGENNRAKTMTDENGVRLLYPLIEYGFDRMECAKIIIDAGLPLPPKSSCFFCPNMNDWEIHQLRNEDPCRFDKAIAMEVNAQNKLTTVRGLSREKKWSEIINQPVLPLPEDYFFELEKMPCSCSL